MAGRRPPLRIETAAAVAVDTLAVVEPEPERGGRHRPAGGLLLVVGAVAILVARAVLAPGLPGAASPAPLPLPPRVGSCVVLDVDRIDVVPCDLPHSGEVAAAWPAGETPTEMMMGAAETASLTVSIKRQLPVVAKDQICDTWVREYVGWTAITLTQGGSGRWITPQPIVSGQLVDAPPSEGIPDRHWTACVVRTSQPLYIGTVRGAAYRTGNVPGSISVCIDIGLEAAEFVPCELPHAVELMAVMALSTPMMVQRDIYLDRSAAETRRLCVERAADRTGTADPTFGGQLEVVTESAWAQRQLPVAVSASGWFVPDCLIRVVGSGKLVESLLGHGDRPLPWQN